MPGIPPDHLFNLTRYTIIVKKEFMNACRAAIIMLESHPRKGYKLEETLRSTSNHPRSGQLVADKKLCSHPPVKKDIKRMKKVCTCLACCICTFFLGLLLAAPAPLRAQQIDTPPTYTLQLMTILDKFTADAELQKIRKRGYDAYLAEYTTQTGRIIYKLRSGKFKTRAAAVAAADQYTEKEGGSVMIVSENAGAGEASRAAAEPAAADGAAAPKGKTVRVTVKDKDTAARPNSLQEKVSALRRGETPAKMKAEQKPEDEIWFTIQTSTEFDKRSAERRINKLRDKGYDAYCTEIVQNGKEFYKIRFGKYGTSKEASEAAENYNARERRNGMVVKIASGVDVASSGDRAAASKKQEPAENTDTREQGQPAAPKKPAALAAAPRNQNSQEPEELPEEIDDRQPAKEQRPPAAGPARKVQPPTAELPSEPEPQAGQKGASDGGREAPPLDDTDAAQVQPPPEQAPKADEPEHMTKIYAYREKSGALNLTNRYEDVPEALRKSIDCISRYPVRIREIAKNSIRLTVEDQEERTEIILAGLTFSGQSESARAYLKALGRKPLRLKYNPWLQTKDNAVAGRLYTKDGFYINLDIMRKGLGQYDAATLPPDQQKAFRQAQGGAKSQNEGGRE